KVRFQGNIIYNKSIPTPYTMDLLREPLTIRVTNLRSVLNNSNLNPDNGRNLVNGTTFTTANLSTIGFYDCRYPTPVYIGEFYPQGMELTVDDLTGYALNPNQHQTISGGSRINSVAVEDNITLRVNTLWPPQSYGTNWTVIFKGSGPTDPSCLELAFMFQNINQTNGAIEPHTFATGTFLYDYFNATHPDLVPGMLEVSIW
ncbi:MAG TPA: hypothetical protein VK450_03290, partial [Methanomicrobiales archaeon]|nr:hypothetical protein [Methanomicrobiales archaeon]